MYSPHGFMEEKKKKKFNEYLEPHFQSLPGKMVEVFLNK